jgi:hypothetical protein
MVGNNMKEIEITLEKVQRVAISFEVPDSVYEEINRTGRLPDDLYEKTKEKLEDMEADVEYDYAVWSETEQRQLIEWG